jgi:hypothetical protein
MIMGTGGNIAEGMGIRTMAGMKAGIETGATMASKSMEITNAGKKRSNPVNVLRQSGFSGFQYTPFDHNQRDLCGTTYP